MNRNKYLHIAYYILYNVYNMPMYYTIIQCKYYATAELLTRRDVPSLTPARSTVSLQVSSDYLRIFNQLTNEQGI